MATDVTPSAPPAEAEARLKKADGTVDWDAFFDAPPHGVIPMILGAKTARALNRCSLTVVESLFSRAGDADLRIELLDLLNTVIPDNDNDPAALDKAKRKLTRILRHIRDDRKARAEAYAGKRAALAEDDDRRTDEVGEMFDENHPWPPDLDALAADPNPTPLFAYLFWLEIRQRLDALRMGARVEEIAAVREPVPFLLSPAFADHFGHIVAAEIAPLVAEKARTIIRQARLLQGPARVDKMRTQIADVDYRHRLWSAWQEAWPERTEAQKLPRRPIRKKQSGLGLLGGKPGKSAMTLEEWKTACKRLRIANKRAEAVWAAIARPSPDYEAPGDDDRRVLMELFGRSPAGLRKEVEAVRQIAEQGGEMGRSFDTYRKDRHPDLGIVAACFRYPELLLGRKRPLPLMLRSYRGEALDKNLPYTVRYFGDYAR